MNENDSNGNLDACARLRAAWQSGRPVVPLFGAGISACASIPFGPHIVEYLIGIHLLYELVGWPGSCADYVATRGWPDANELNAELAARCGPRLPSELDRVRSQLDRRASPRAPLGAEPSASGQSALAVPKWFSLIHHIAERRDELIEAFFDGLVRGRRPGNAHQFIAYLAKLMGWRLILSTNFDDLIETALREDGLAPVVYELVRGGTLPDQRLVARHLSVIKLHGGAFGLRTGFDLHEPTDPLSCATFTKYLPSDALLLAVGQGGREERVLSLVRSLLETHGSRREIIWVHYEDEPPPALAELPKQQVHLQHYGEASSFFHDLYQRLAFCHPVGRESYRAIQHLPEVPLSNAESRPVGARSRAPSRQAMYERYEAAKALPVTRLWFNLYQFTSVAAFIGALLEELHRNDRQLPALFLSPVLAFTDLERVCQPGAGNDEEACRERNIERFRWHIAYALRRQGYFIALDALNGFSNPQSTLNVQMEGDESSAIARRLRHELYAFVRSLSGSDLGQSEIYVSPEPADCPPGGNALEPAAFESNPCEPELLEHADHRPRGGVTFVLPPKEVDSPPASEPKLRSVHHLPWLVLRVAISFRKPRPVSALVRLTAKEIEVPSSPTASQRSAAFDGDRAAERSQLYAEIQAAIDQLVVDGFLERQDGGLYSMNGKRRDALFEVFARDERNRAIDLQYKIAMYYRASLYEQSRDITAYLEYVFHRLACIDDKPSGGGWHRLFGSLDRERAHVLARGQAASLLDALCVVRLRLDKAGGGTGRGAPSAIERRRFVKQLQRMCLEIRLSVSDVEQCILEHMKVAHSLMQAAPTLLGAIDHPYGRGALLAQLELFERAFAKFDSSGQAEVSDVFELIENVLSVVEGTGRLFVVRQESHAPRALVERSLTVLESLSSRIGNPHGKAARKLALLEVRCFQSLMDIALRQVSPWSSSPAAMRLLGERQGAFVALFELARDRLVEFGQRGQGMPERFSRLRLLLARKAYLSGHFGRAAEELNRAHAFAERSVDARGAALAVYHLHRAEYAILSFRHGGAGRPRSKALTSLIDDALTALDQAEAEFGSGRRDVFWMVRLFVLRARAHLELLCVRVEQLAACGYGPAPDIELERAASGALTALYGAWINNHQNAQRTQLIDELWDDLRQNLERGDRARSPQHSFQAYWQQRNAAAGLDAYHRTRDPAQPGSRP